MSNYFKNNTGSGQIILKITQDPDQDPDPDTDTDPNPDPKLSEKSDPDTDPKKIIPDPQHCLKDRLHFF
jgi:hypothetical protein